MPMRDYNMQKIKIQIKKTSLIFCLVKMIKKDIFSIQSIQKKYKLLVIKDQEDSYEKKVNYVS